MQCYAEWNHCVSPAIQRDVVKIIVTFHVSRFMISIDWSVFVIPKKNIRLQISKSFPVKIHPAFCKVHRPSQPTILLHTRNWNCYSSRSSVTENCSRSDLRNTLFYFTRSFKWAVSILYLKSQSNWLLLAVPPVLSAEWTMSQAASTWRICWLNLHAVDWWHDVAQTVARYP